MKEAGRPGLHVVADHAHAAVAAEVHEEHLGAGPAVVVGALPAADGVAELAVAGQGRRPVAGLRLVEDLDPVDGDGDRLRLAAAHGRYGPQVPRAQLRVMEGGAGNGGRLRRTGIGQRRAGRHAGVLTAGGQDPRQHAAGHGEQGETGDLREWRASSHCVAFRDRAGSFYRPPADNTTTSVAGTLGGDARADRADMVSRRGGRTDASSRPIGLSRGAKPRRLTIPFKTGCLVAAVRGEAPGVEALSTHGCKFSDDTQASGDT